MEGCLLKRFVLLLTCLFIVKPCFAIEDTSLDVPPPINPKKSFSGTFDVVTNYLSEGLSTSNNAPGIQGSLTYTFTKTGIYLNVFGTNADFIDPEEHHATVEFDTVLGVTNDINENWNYNIYLDRYNYPGAPAANYMDLIATLTYKIFSATAYYSPNVFGSHETGVYLNGYIHYKIPEKYISFSNISALASIGHYQLPIVTGIHSYYDFMAGIQKEIKAFTLILQYTNTSGANLHPWDGYHIVGTVLFAF